MQQAPVMKGSGLKPLDESKSSDQPVHIFGSNLEARVVTDGSGEESKPITFGTIEDSKKEDDIETIRKRKFDAITGEEDEETVFQGDFKLFAWDLSSSNWVEKGRGQLKLNDSLNQENSQSRIIVRVGGTLKIVLNVAIRHSTFRVIASSKTSIRFTDSQTVWAASGSNASQLRELIDERIRIAAEQEAEAAKKKPKTADEDAKSEIDRGKDELEKKEADDSNERTSESEAEKRISLKEESTVADKAKTLDKSESDDDESPESDHDRGNSNCSSEHGEVTQEDNVGTEAKDDTPKSGPTVEEATKDSAKDEDPTATNDQHSDSSEPSQEES